MQYAEILHTKLPPAYIPPLMHLVRVVPSSIQNIKYIREVTKIEQLIDNKKINKTELNT